MSDKGSVFRLSSEDWGDFSYQLSKETDLGAALASAAFLDDLLAALIEAFLVDDRGILRKLLTGPTAPLGTLNARILASYSIGLISQDESHDLAIVREVRNQFAHLPRTISFDTPSIAKAIAKLTIPHLVPNEAFDTSKLSNRQLFINATSMIATFLDKRRRVIRDRRVSAPKFYIELTDKPA